MATRNKIARVMCEYRNPKTNKICGDKSSMESSVEVAFNKAEKTGWTMKKINDKAIHYFCPKCSHKIKTA